MATIAFIHTRHLGHIGPATRLGRILTAQGHRVIAWAPERHRALVESTGAEFVRHDPIGQLQSVSRQPSASASPAPEDPAAMWRGVISATVAFNAAAAELHLEPLVEELFARDVEIVVHDINSSWGRLAADFLGLPRAVSHPLFFRSRHDMLITPEFVGPQIVNTVARARETILRRWGVDLGDCTTTLVNPGPVTITYTTPHLAGHGKGHPGWHYAGALMQPIVRSPPASSRPLVYVAFGTAERRPLAPFHAAVAALRDLPVDVVVSTGHAVCELGPVPDNVTVHEFVASRDVLARASLHLSHGGCGAVHESLLAGVPMVLTPQQSDQGGWAMRLQTLGAGTIVEPDADALATCAQWMLTDPGPAARARALGEHLNAFDGTRRMTELFAGLA